MLSNVLQSIQTEFQDNWSETKIKFGDAGFTPQLEGVQEWIQVSVLPIGSKPMAYGTRVDESHGLYVTVYSRNQLTSSVLTDRVSSMIQNKQVDAINISTPQPKGQGTTIAQTGTDGKYYIRTYYPMRVMCGNDIFNIPPPPVIVPRPIIDPVTGDNIIDYDEYQNGVTITGTGVDGNTIVATFSSGTIPLYGALAVVANGVWSYYIPTSDLASFGEGSETISTVQVTPDGDKSPPVTLTFEVNMVKPAIPAPTIDTIAGDDIIDYDESLAGVNITGTGIDNHTVIVMFGSQMIPTHGNAVTVNNGVWTLPMNTADINDIGQGTETITVHQTDPAGDISAYVTATFVVDAVEPGPPATPPTIDTIAQDDHIDYDEYLAGVTITGTGVDGNTIDATFNSGTILMHGQSAIVSNGVWSIPLSSIDLDSMGQGQELVSVTQTTPENDTSSIVSTTITIEVIKPIEPAVEITDLSATSDTGSITLTWTDTPDEVYDIYVNNVITYTNVTTPFEITTECEATYFVTSNTTVSSEESNYVIGTPIQEVLTISDLSATDGTIIDSVQFTFTEQTEPTCSV